MQVLLLHFATGLLPGLALSTPKQGTLAGFVHASPLFVLYDGYSAVYLFFILSGYVLTLAFQARETRPLPALAGRLVRLGLPALVAGILSATIFAVFGGLNPEVGRLVDSTWYAHLWQPTLGVANLVKDVVVSGLLLGYLPVEPWMGLLPGWRLTLDVSLSAPLWTLSVELYGSVLIWLLVALERRGAWPWRIGLAVALLLLLRGPYLCFLAGHLMARHRFAERAPVVGRLPALLLILGGLAMCVMAEFRMLPPVTAFCAANLPLVPCSPGGLQQKIYGSLLVFVGLVQLPWLRQALQARWARGLGEISFSLYLTHWPLLFGPVAALVLALQGPLGLPAARLFAIVAGLALSFALARLFLPVDRLAVRLSRRVQGRRPAISRS